MVADSAEALFRRLPRPVYRALCLPAALVLAVCETWRINGRMADKQ